MSGTKSIRERLKESLLAMNPDALINWSTVVLLVLLPSFFIPTFSDGIVVGKRILLVVLMFFALLAWFLRAYRAHGIRWSVNPLIWGPWAILLTVGISAAASIAPYASWVGFAGQGVNAVIPLTALCTLWLVARTAPQKDLFLRKVTMALFAGVAIAAILGALSLLRLLPSSVFAEGMTPSGVYQVLTLLTSIVSVWFMAIWLFQDKEGDLWFSDAKGTWLLRVAGGVSIAYTAVLLLVSADSPARMVLLVGSLLLTALALFDPKQLASPARLWAPMGGLALSLVLLFFGSPFHGSLPQEYMLDTNVSWHVVKETAALRGPFGSGPDTYGLTYLHTRPESVLATDYWMLQLDRGSNAWMTWAATWGLIPTVLLCGFLVLIAMGLFHGLVLRRKREDWQATAALGVVWSSLVAMRFVYPSDIALEVPFWLVTGLVCARLAAPSKKHASAHSAAALTTSIGFALAGVAFVAVVVLSTQALGGDWYIAKAAKAKRAGESPARVLALIRSAERMNPWRADYAQAHALEGLAYAERLAADVTDEADSQEAFLEVLESSASAASRAIARDRFSPDAAHTLGQVYEAMSGAVAGAMPVALEGYRSAVELDPVNPNRYNTLVRVLLRASDKEELAGGDLDARDLYLREALALTAAQIDLDPTRATSYYQRALVLERQGNLTDAIGQIEQLVLAAPKDPVLRFELGVLHIRAGNKAQARASLERAVELSPTYANAKWYLASVYEEAGEVEGAIRLLEDLLILDPNSTLVADKLRLLRAGVIDADAADTAEPLPTEEDLSG